MRNGSISEIKKAMQREFWMNCHFFKIPAKHGIEDLLSRRFSLSFLVLALVMCVPSLVFPATVVIDNFSTEQAVTVSGEGTNDSQQVGLGIIGGERDLRIAGAIGAVGLSVGQIAGNQIIYQAPIGGGSFLLVYDGEDGDDGIRYDLLGADLTDGGTQCALLIRLVATDTASQVDITVYTDASNYSSLAWNVPAHPSGSDPLDFVIPFSEFSPAGSGGADFSSVGAITMEFNLPSQTDISISLLQTTIPLTYEKTVALIPTADFDPVGTANPYDKLRYTVDINNPADGNGATVSGVYFMDIPDENTRLVDTATTAHPGASIISGHGGDDQVEVDVGDIADGQTATIYFDVIIDPLPAGVDSVVNQGQITAGLCSAPGLTDDPDVDLNFPDPTETPVEAAPAISVDKTDGISDPVSPGATVTYTIYIQNTGDQGASEVRFTDDLGTHYSLVVGSVAIVQASDAGAVVEVGNVTGDDTVVVYLGTVPPGAMQPEIITFDVVVNDPVADGVDQISNQGYASGSNFTGNVLSDDPNSDETGDERPTITDVDAAPEIKATKTDNLSSAVSPGNTVTYEVVVENAGNMVATNVLFTDTPGAYCSLVPGTVTSSPKGTVTTGNDAGDTQVAVDIGSLSTGSANAVTITFDVVVVNPFPTGVPLRISNQGTVSGGNFTPAVSTDDPDTGTVDDATVTQIDASPDISATKTDNLTQAASPGDTVTYEIVIRNDGDMAATGVVFTDTPGDYYSLVPGTVTSTPKGIVTTGNGGSDTQVVVNVGDVDPGATNAVTIAFDVIVDNPFPTGVPMSISNQGTVSGGNFTPAVSTDDPDTGTVDDATVTQIDASPDISATKTDNLTQSVSPGDTVSYEIVIRNDGDMAATGVVFTDTPGDYYSLVPGTVTSTPKGIVTTGNGGSDTQVVVNVGDVDPGAANAVTIAFDVIVDNPFPTGVPMSISNQGTVSGGNFDPDVPTDDPANGVGDNDATVTPIGASPVVSATKTDNLTSSQAVSPGDTVTYQVVIKNDGDIAATGVVFSDTPGDYCSLVPGSVTSTPQGTVTAGNGGSDTQVVVNVGDVDPGDANKVTIAFDVIVEDPFPAGVPLSISNQGTVEGDNFDPDVITDDPDNGTGDYNPTVTTVDAATQIVVEKTDSIGNDAGNIGIVDPGDTISYRIVIQNNGDLDAEGVVFTDPPVDNAELVVGSVSTNKGTVTVGNGANDTSVEVNVGPLAGNGGSVTIEFDVVVDNPLPAGVDQVSNQGSADGDNFDPVDSDDPSIGGTADPTITHLTATPVVTATKVDALFDDADGDNFFGPGDTIQYTITITNSGNTEATGVVLQDPAVANAALVAGTVTPSQGTVVQGNNPGDNAVQVNVGNIPADGGAATLTFHVLIANPLPDGITRISNQATISGTNLSESVVTDDPSTPAQNDPTVTPILPVSAEKTAVLQIDNNNNGVANPGDTIRYTIAIVNDGPQDSTDTVFTDLEDDMVNSALVSGSVVTTQGTVTSGNTDGDASVVVALGTLPANGGEATVIFDVVIDNPFPLDADSIDNQGSVQYVFNNQAMQVLTDEPGTAVPEDETVVEVEPEPVIPTLSEIGTLLMALLLTAATLLVARRKKA